MTKKLMTLVACLVFTMGLFADFSISESPNGHTYNPRFDQCENFDMYGSFANYVEMNLDTGDLAEYYVYHMTSNSPLTIHLCWSLHLPSLYPYSIVYDVWVDGVQIVDNGIIDDDTPNPIIISTTAPLYWGIHTLKVKAVSELPLPLFCLTDSTKIFQLIPQNTYYQNDYATIIPYTNGVSSHDAIRPALFVEGFSAPGIVEGGSSYTNSLLSRWKWSLTDTKIYMLQLRYPTQDLRDNAMIVLGALRFIHNIQPTNQLLEGTSVYGYSMGGILARYALAFAEHWNIPHYCTQYISLDAPHRGVALNSSFQDLFCNLEEWMDYNAVYFNIAEENPDQLDPYLDGLKTASAKQLIRNNIFAGDEAVTYATGSDAFLDFFAEINEEERLLHGTQVDLINSNPAYPDTPYKPGFPHKQNNIKSIAYSNGSLFPKESNNVSVLSDYNVHLHIKSSYLSYILGHYVPDLTSSDAYSASAQPHDFQPGSVLDDIGSKDTSHKHKYTELYHYNFDLNQYFAPALVPTRSSLFLKSSSTNGGEQVAEFDISNFSSLDTHTDAFLDHTYFDHLIYAPPAINQTNPVVPHYNCFGQWNWRHGELCWARDSLDVDWVGANITSADAWLDQPENRAVSFIRGQVEDNDLGQITSKKMFLNGIEYQDIELDPYGNYEIPFLYTRDANVRLVFEKPGCLPTYRDISMHYSDAMLHDYAVPKATMRDFNLNNIIVAKNGDGSFISINTAIDFIYDYLDSGLYNNEPIRIRVLAGTYPESVDLSPLAALGIADFTLEGEGNAVIEGSVILNCLNASQLQSAAYKIKGISFTNTALGIGFKDIWDDSVDESHAPHIKLTVESCQFQTCGYSIIPGGSSLYGAAGIHFEGAGVIRSCSFTDNFLTAIHDNLTDNLLSGAVYVRNNSIDSVLINNCTFTNNQGAVSGGLVICGTGDTQVLNNTFEHNLNVSYCSNDYESKRSNAISVFSASNAELAYNTFVDNFDSMYSGTVVYLENTSLLPQAQHPIKFINNTIHNNLPEYTGAILSAITFAHQTEPPTDQDIIIQNNVLSCPFPTSGARITSANGYSTPKVNNNILYNTLPVGFTISNEPTHLRFNYTCNPLLGNNYRPLWTQSVISPCIDTGIGNNDPDGTPPDIGAKRAENHAWWEYSFTNQADLEKWYWVSYPVLNSRTNDALKASEFFEELLKVYLKDINGIPTPTPIYLDEIDWMVGGGLTDIQWSLTEHAWSPNQHAHYVSSPQGYKVKLLPRTNPDFPNTVTLRESGFKTNSTLPFTIYGEVENWLGYFKEDPAWPHEAFASIWQDINMIKTKDWCLVRARSDGDYWGMSGKLFPLKYGDMVVVTTNNDHTFQWNDSNPTPPIKKTLPEHFIFAEKQDYVPVYVSLPDSLKIDLKEIGLYLDGVCKGAVVVEDSLEQICAYLDINEKLTDGVVEFVFYYNPDKAQPQECRTLRIDNSRFAAQYVKGNRRYPFYNITLSSKDLENVAPLEFALNQNYPNPFNPTTTISYQLPESGKVRLDIYNLKGQLVKTLIDGSQDSGLHSIVWNGTDRHNRSVASGVYLYRLSSLNKVQTKRMLLMK